MAITDISISEELMTDAPSIKYRGDEGPKSPQKEKQMMADALLKEEYDKYIYDLLEQRPDATPMSFEEFKRMVIAEGKMASAPDSSGIMMAQGGRIGYANGSEGPVLPEDPTKPVNPFQPKPIGPVLPDKMAFDDTPRFELKNIDELILEFEMDNGRRPTSIDDLKRYFYIKYGDEGIAKIEEVISDRQTAAYGGIMGADGRKQYGIGSYFQKLKDKVVDDIIPNEIKDNPLLTAALLAGGDYALNEGKLSKGVLNSIFGKDVVSGSIDSPSGTDISQGNKTGGLLEILKRAGKGVVDTGRQIFDYKTGDDRTLGSDILGGISKNIVPIVGGLTAGLFTKNQPEQPGLPDDNTALQLADLKKSANLLNQQQGLATGMNFLPAVAARKFTPEEMAVTYAQAANGGRIGFENAGPVVDEQTTAMILDMNKRGMDVNTISAVTQQNAETVNAILSAQNKQAEGGIMDLGGMEKDYRNTGGFVDIGAKEKADDVPARLSVNEFVFTADAVRNAGGGDIDEGAKIMENMMKHLEQGGQISEESQGMAGARDMFATSERLSEVI